MLFRSDILKSVNTAVDIDLKVYELFAGTYVWPTGNEKTISKRMLASAMGVVFATHHARQAITEKDHTLVERERLDS